MVVVAAVPQCRTGVGGDEGEHGGDGSVRNQEAVQALTLHVVL